jgi:hypothetical protein
MLLRLTLLHKATTTTVLALCPSLRLTFSLLCVFGRMRTMAKLLLVRRHLHNVRSQSTSCTFFVDETSALRGNMPQRNDAESSTNPRLSFSPASSVWGQMGRPWTTDGRNAPRTTENITEQDYVAFFHQFLGFTNNHALAPSANVQCRCQRYFMGGDGAWDHLNSGIHHNANWTRTRACFAGVGAHLSCRRFCHQAQAGAHE